MNLNLPLAMAFAAGVFVSHIDRIFHGLEPEPITESPFGFADLATDHPHCQTDMTYSDQWSPRLMYLNGVWTAACVAQSEVEGDSHD